MFVHPHGEIADDVFMNAFLTLDLIDDGGGSIDVEQHDR